MSYVITILVFFYFHFFFFFKQKTAYEMRINDWSSDVCSSDLVPLWLQLPSTRLRAATGQKPGHRGAWGADSVLVEIPVPLHEPRHTGLEGSGRRLAGSALQGVYTGVGVRHVAGMQRQQADRQRVVSG